MRNYPPNYSHQLSDQEPEQNLCDTQNIHQTRPKQLNLTKPKSANTQIKEAIATQAPSTPEQKYPSNAPNIKAKILEATASQNCSFEDRLRSKSKQSIAHVLQVQVTESQVQLQEKIHTISLLSYCLTFL